MIPDEVEPEVIDFTWFYFVGKRCLNLSIKEIGRMTVKTFMRFYQHYKDNWDVEMRLTNANMTYKEAAEKAKKSEEWF